MLCTHCAAISFYWLTVLMTQWTRPSCSSKTPMWCHYQLRILTSKINRRHWPHMSLSKLFSMEGFELKLHLPLRHPPPLTFTSSPVVSAAVFLRPLSLSDCVASPSAPPLSCRLFTSSQGKRIFRFSHSIYARMALTHCAAMLLSGSRSKSGREGWGGGGWRGGGG